MKRKSMAQIRKNLRDKEDTQGKVLDILYRADLYQSVIGEKMLARPAKVADEPIIDKFTNFLATQTVNLPDSQGKTVELLKAMQENVY